VTLAHSQLGVHDRHYGPMNPLDLYGLPLECFTEERNALARELRREGDRDEAARVTKLRKPSVAAWAVNQLVRTQRREVAALFGVGDALQQAQADLLAKRGDAGALRNAVDAERAVVDRLAEKARGLLSSEGHELTPAMLERVTETLHAAALDVDARAQMRDGCLERELLHIGLGALGGASTSPSGTGRRRQPETTGNRASRDGQDLDRARKAERATALKAARKAEVVARRRAERAGRELNAVQERRDRVAEVLRDADQALATARERADEAARELRDAEQAVEQLTS
jgi:hypothetical protein